MWNALGHVLPIAVAGALSSVPLTATIVILLSPNQRRSSIPYLVGWVAGLAGFAVLFSFLAQLLPLSPRRQPQVAIGIVELIIGVALEVLAVIQWRRRPRVRSGAEPRWLRAVSSFGPWSSLAFAFVLNFRPKAILLSAATGLTVSGASLSIGQAAIVIAVYVLISASTVVGLVVTALVAPGKTQPWLVRTRDWIAANGALVTILVLVLIGVVVFGNGLTRFG